MSDQINRADIMALPKLSLTLGKMGRIELHHEKPLKGVSQWVNVKDVDGLRYADQFTHPTLADAIALSEIAALVEALNVSIVFAEKIADAVDIDPDETSLTVTVMPGGREVATRTWAEVLAQGRAALAAVKGGDA